MREFQYLKPTSVEEASLMLAEFGEECRVMAAGSGMILAMRQRMLMPSHIISVSGIQSLRGIDFDPVQGLRIGALTRHIDVAQSPIIKQHYPSLAYMAGKMANPQVRHQGTLGGNLCYGDPATDPPTCLMALQARVVLASARGQRELTLGEFLVDYFVTAIQSDEVLVEIRIDAPAKNQFCIYNRFKRTEAEHRPLVSTAVVVRRDAQLCHEARLVVGASTIIPQRVDQAEQFLEGKNMTVQLCMQAAQIVADQIEPISDNRGSSEYRKEMVRIVTGRTLEQIFGLSQIQ